MKKRRRKLYLKRREERSRKRALQACVDRAVSAMTKAYPLLVATDDAPIEFTETLRLAEPLMVSGDTLTLRTTVTIQEL